MGLWVCQGLGLRQGSIAAIEQGSQAGQDRGQVPGPAFAQAVAAGQRQALGNRAEGSQGRVFLSGTGHHQQMPAGAAARPGLELLEAIAPVTPAAEQPHQHQPGALKAGPQVVVEHGGVLQRRQVQATQLTRWP